MARVELTNDAKEDLRDLDRSAQKQVVRKLKELETSPELRGKPLGARQAGNLSGFRSLTVGNREYRIVYRVTTDGAICVVSVIAARCGDEVYAIAVARLETAADRELAGELHDVLDAVFTKRGT